MRVLRAYTRMVCIYMYNIIFYKKNVHSGYFITIDPSGNCIIHRICIATNFSVDIFTKPPNLHRCGSGGGSNHNNNFGRFHGKLLLR